MAGVQVRLDWSGSSDVLADPVNAVLVQGIGNEVVLSFGHAVPPTKMAVMTEEEVVEHLKQNSVEVKRISRFTLPVDTAKILLKGLQNALAGNPPAVPVSEEGAS